MTKIKNLEVTNSGIYHLRIQKNGINRRLSLKTKNQAEANLAAAIMRATLSAMQIDPTKIKSWTLETNGQDVKITTEDNDKDRASALEAVKVMAESRAAPENSYNSVIQNRHTITIGEALIEYHEVLSKHTIAEKTKVMARSSLAQMVAKLGAGFNVGAHDLQDQIEQQWVNVRLVS